MTDPRDVFNPPGSCTSRATCFKAGFCVNECVTQKDMPEYSPVREALDKIELAILRTLDQTALSEPLSPNMLRVLVEELRKIGKNI